MKRSSSPSMSPTRRQALLVLVAPIVAAAAFPSTVLGLLVATTPPGTDAPPPATDAAPVAPGTVVTTTPSGGGGDSINWGPIVVGILLVVVAIAIIAALMSRRAPAPPAPAPTPAPRPAPAPPSAESQTLSTAQWVHDQLSLEVLAAEPVAAATRWNAERTRLDGVAITSQQLWAAGRGDTWQSLAQTMSALASAIDTNVNLRSQPEVDATLVHESVAVVNRQRAVLQQIVNALWPTAQR